MELRLVNPKAGRPNPRDAQRPVALPDPRDAQHRDDTALPYPSEEEQHRLRVVVEDALAGFPAREQDIVRKRLLADDPATLERLGAAWGVSKERVRQIEQATKARMRTRLMRAGAAPSSVG